MSPFSSISSSFFACAATAFMSGELRHSSGTSLRSLSAAIFWASSLMRARRSRASRSSWRRSASSFVAL